jgi:hypothetical protein
MHADRDENANLFLITPDPDAAKYGTVRFSEGFRIRNGNSDPDSAVRFRNRRFIGQQNFLLTCWPGY